MQSKLAQACAGLLTTVNNEMRYTNGRQKRPLKVQPLKVPKRVANVGNSRLLRAADLSIQL